jgi:hypothetical protein
MKRLKNITFLIILASSSGFAAEPDSTDELYENLLDRHAKSGHLSGKELKKQKFYHKNQKSWQGDFSKQVRGVASTLKSQREIMKFQNPAIEISVK